MKKIFFLISLMITFIVIALSLSVGSVFIPIKSLLFLSPMDEYMKMIVFDLRLPRILMAFLVGMLLASSGNIVQIIFQNPLADPYIIGIASSATFGAVIAYLLRLPEISYGIVAFICCMVSTLLIFKISKRGNKIEVNTINCWYNFISIFSRFYIFCYLYDRRRFIQNYHVAYGISG